MFRNPNKGRTVKSTVYYNLHKKGKEIPCLGLCRRLRPWRKERINNDIYSGSRAIVISLICSPSSSAIDHLPRIWFLATLFLSKSWHVATNSNYLSSPGRLVCSTSLLRFSLPPSLIDCIGVRILQFNDFKLDHKDHLVFQFPLGSSIPSCRQSTMRLVVMPN